jgi:class 3 adenylate cyclase/pimeloyl-ACP methyl ester carboxylesterase
VAAPGEIRFARADDGIEIAYLTAGEGPRDLVLIFGFTTHLDLCWDMPWFSQWLRRTSQHFRTIVFDKRGSGLSDRSLGHGSIEDRTRDVLAVMDAVGSERASFVGISEGGPMSIVCAAMHPERVERMALYGTMARIRWAPDYPEGVPPEVAEMFTQGVGNAWGSGEVMGTFFFNHASDPAQAAAQVAKFERNACTRQMAVQMAQANVDIDVRAFLPAVSAPTLVLHASDDPLVPPAIGRYLAEHIPGARHQEVPGDFHCSWRIDDANAVIDLALGFLVDEPAPLTASPPTLARAPEAATRRAVATVLFTDIVGSTERAAAVGDTAWRDLLDRHDQCASEAIARRGGRLVKSTGDGVLATFDGPSRAIDATRAIHTATAGLGLEIRAGVHTGEVERRGDDVSGIGVHIAARVASMAGPGEILATRTVRDLTAGSHLVFTARGSHELKGVPDAWELFEVG